jgi:serine/threonine-protein kinase
MLAFEGSSGGKNLLFLRHLNKQRAIALTGTEGGSRPFFSPDGKWIGFRTPTKLKKISVDGGAPIDICEAFSRDASWGERGEIVFTGRSSERAGNLMLVSARGGLAKPLESADSTKGYAVSPHVLPGGHHVIFTTIETRGDVEGASIMLQSIEGGEKRTLIRGGTTPKYVPTGHIIYVRSGTLMAVPFDLETLTITGPSSPLAEEVYITPGGTALFRVSMDGTLIYKVQTQTELVWVDRQGGVATIPAPAHNYWLPRLSPDGRRIAVDTRDSGFGAEIWVYELARGTLTRLTVNPGEDETPYWSPGGRWLAFASSRTGQARTVFRKLVDGSDAAEPLWTNDHHMHVECWSQDGRSIIVMVRAATSSDDLWLLSIDDEITARPLLQTRFSERLGRISPDGRWLAYNSNESGRQEVYVQAFPGLGNKVPISANGGSQPVWAADGKELFYRGEGNLMVVTVVPGETFAVTSPQPLFPDHYAVQTGTHTGYDVSKDGKRFLMIKSKAPQLTNLNVAFNWFEEVKRLAPEGK